METDQVAGLAAVVARRAPGDGLHQSAIPALAFYRASAPTEHDETLYQPCLCIMLQGAKEVIVGEEVYRYDPIHSLVVSVELPATSRVVKATADCPCLVIRISFDCAVVAEYVTEGHNAPTPGPPSRALGVAPTGRELLDAVGRLVALLNTPHDIESLSPLVLREITYRVLMGPHGPWLRQTAAHGASAHRVAVAIRWLKIHLREPLRVEALAHQVSMSPSSFHMHFKAVTALSPLQYQKRLRLQEARMLMLSEGLDAAQAAYRVGYESPSQFSREYSRMFGTPPRKDVTTLKIRIGDRI
jgi:AraC-like DNA-binding protein